MREKRVWVAFALLALAVTWSIAGRAQSVYPVRFDSSPQASTAGESTVSVGALTLRPQPQAPVLCQESTRGTIYAQELGPIVTPQLCICAGQQYANPPAPPDEIIYGWEDLIDGSFCQNDPPV